MVVINKLKMICPNCKENITNPQKFCPKCETPLDNDVSNIFDIIGIKL